jgi:lipopolysaccharide biosynthesis protein
LAGDLARDNGEWVAAAEHYRLYLARDPGCFQIWVQLGHMLKEAGRRSEAAAAYDEALKINSVDADLLLQLGHLNKLMGLEPEAIEFYRRSAAIDGNPDAKAELRLLGEECAGGPLKKSASPGKFRWKSNISRPKGRLASTAGVFEELDGPLARGWAWNSRRPTRPATVEFLVDGRCVHTCVANLERVDVRSGILTGFQTEIPASALRGTEGEVQVHARLSGSAVELLNSPRTTTFWPGRNRAQTVVTRAPSPSTWALPDPPLRAIAYYLPQFHPFPENDRWWGRGFTDWTNVTRGTPQFPGHYQPHRPGELGYYDLRLAEVQERQAALAKLYGLGGFCFYFYWFSGRVLMERPIDNFTSNPNIDFPFCLCWANENWTRKWDGRESHVLIGHDYSMQDDIEFISRVSEYMLRRNYIRVDDRPLLLVYRADLLPDARATAQRWRTYCQDRGLGDIYLVCTQSFTATDPRAIGFDAAVEFPPNSTPMTHLPTTDLTGNGAGQTETFYGSRFDYAEAVEKAAAPRTHDYPLLRGLFTSWDNTVRRRAGSTVFVNSTPSLYRRYLETIGDQLLCDSTEPRRDPLVFINAWNEWAEGAHLEPDERHGYAYLEATRMALIRSGARIAAVRERRFGKPEERPRLAVVVHAFYLDVLEELLPQFEGYPAGSEFFFTTPPENQAALTAMLSRLAHPSSVVITENRGRDVAPFLAILRLIWPRHFRYILKLHTKRSTHRADGHFWRDEVYRSLAHPAQIDQVIRLMDARPDTGIVGVAAHVVPMTTYWGSNATRVLDLAERLGVGDFDERSTSFVAGTMFAARLEALEPLMGLSLTEEDFEPETGQTDATLAHAIERAISLSAAAVGLKVCGLRGRGDELEIIDEAAASSFAFAKPTAPHR